MAQVIDVIDINEWREQRMRLASRRDALGPALAAHAEWAHEAPARWLWSLLSQVADSRPEQRELELEGLPLPPAVTAWLHRGAALLGASPREVVALWLAEVHRRRESARTAALGREHRAPVTASPAPSP